MTLRRYWFIFLIAILLTVIIFFIFKPHPEDDVISKGKREIKNKIREFENSLSLIPQTEASKTQQPQEQPLLLKIRLNPGDTLDYKFSYTQRFDVKFNVSALTPQQQQNPPPQNLSYQLIATLAITCYKSQDVYTLGLKFRDVLFDGIIQNQKISYQQVIQQLSSKEIIFQFYKDARIASIFMPVEFTSDVKNIAKYAILGMQIILKDKSSYEEEEEDLTGKYIAQYQLKGIKESGEEKFAQIEKNKSRYKEVFLYGQKLYEPAVDINSDSRAFFNITRGYFNAITTQEESKFISPVVSGTSQVDLDYYLMNYSRQEISQNYIREVEKVVRGISKSYEQTTPGGAYITPMSKAPEQTNIMNLIMSLEQLLEQFGGRLTPESWQLVQQIIELLKIDENAHIAWQLFEQLSEAAKSILISSFQEASTAKTQEILRMIATSPFFQEHIKVEGIISLSLLRNPSQETIQLLKQLATQQAGSVSTTAYAGLGTAFNLTKDESILQFILENKHRFDEELYLQALGNTGSEKVFNELTNYIYDENKDPSIRASALFALRFIPKQEVDGILAKMLDDSNPEMQINAIMALQFRNSQLAKDTIYTAYTHPNPDVRRYVLEYLSAQHTPEALDIIKFMSQNDPNENIRNMALESLQNR